MTTMWRVTPDSDQVPSPRRVRRARLLIVAGLGVVAVLLVGAFVLGRQSTTRPTTPATMPAQAPATAAPAAGDALTVPGGFRQVAGVPVGYAHTEAGARSAAVNYVVAIGSPVMFVPAKRHALYEAIVDPAQLPALQAKQDAGYPAILDRLGLDASGAPLQPGVRLVARVIPAGVQTVAYSPDLAVMSVWEDGLEGMAGPGTTSPVKQLWGTATVTLHWTAGDWKWQSETGTEGPVPVVGVQAPSDSSVIADATDSFRELTYAGR